MFKKVLIYFYLIYNVIFLSIYRKENTNKFSELCCTKEELLYPIICLEFVNSHYAIIWNFKCPDVWWCMGAAGVFVLKLAEFYLQVQIFNLTSIWVYGFFGCFVVPKPSLCLQLTMAMTVRIVQAMVVSILIHSSFVVFTRHFAFTGY